MKIMLLLMLLLASASADNYLLNNVWPIPTSFSYNP